MSRNPNDPGYAAGDQDGTDADAPSNANPTQTAGRRNGSQLKYIAMIAIVVVVVAILYYVSGSGGQNLSSSQILANVSNSNLNQTQSLFVGDLQKSQNLSSLYVSYYSSNGTYEVPESSNLTLAITSNQTIDSYKLDNYNRTTITSITTYANSKTGAQIAKNVSSIYYYDSNTTITCFNTTAYSGTVVENSSLQCGPGDQGLDHIEETPFTAANVSILAYLVFNNTVTYGGAKSVLGRSCDNFIISNETSANLESNYSSINICIDKQYGIPLYLNQTNVVHGVPSSYEFAAIVVSANVSGSEFIIPQKYLNAVSSPV